MIEKEEPGDPEWFPVQHHFGLTAFGANVYSASAAGDNLLERHDETHSGQEELYLVVAGSALFELDGEEVRAEAPFVVAVNDPAVMRAARAVEAGTIVVALGGERRDSSTRVGRATTSTAFRRPDACPTPRRCSSSPWPPWH